MFKNIFERFLSLFGLKIDSGVSSEAPDSKDEEDGGFANIPEGLMKSIKVRVEEERVKDSIKFRSWAILWYVVTIIAIFVFLSGEDVLFGFSYRELAFALLALYTFSSFETVPGDETGTKNVWKKPYVKLNPGFQFVPRFITRLQRLPAVKVQDELPAEPQFIFRPQKGASQQAPPGFFPPTRIPFGRQVDDASDNEEGYLFTRKDGIGDKLVNKPGEHYILSRDDNLVWLHNSDKHDPLNERLTEEVVGIPRYYIVDPKRFIVNLGTLDNAQQQLRDEVEAVFFRDLAKYTPAVVLANMSYFNFKLLQDLRKLVGEAQSHDDWGIIMESAKIKQLVFSRTLNSAIQAKGVAKGLKEGIVIDAAAEKIKRVEEGAGAASAIKAAAKGEIDGRTEGYVNQVKALRLDARDVLGADTARNIAGEGDKVFVSGTKGLSELISTGLAVGEALKPSTKKDSSEDGGKEESK